MLKKPNTEDRVLLKVVFLLMIVVVVAAVWFFGHYNHQKNTVLYSKTTISNRETNYLPTGSVDNAGKRTTYTYPGNYFMISYPSDWTIKTTTVYYSSPFPIELNLVPPEAPLVYASGTEAVTVRAYKSMSLSAAVDQFETTQAPTQSESLIINGYPAIFQQYVQSPSLNNETYTDDIYAVLKGSTTVVFYFRVSESTMPASAGLSQTPAFNETMLLPVFNGIVTSLQFN